MPLALPILNNCFVNGIASSTRIRRSALDVHGLLADLNVQGHFSYLHHLLETLDVWPVLDAIGIELATFARLRCLVDTNDRTLWTRCQQEGWVLLTDDRNADDRNSLQATLADSWQPGNLPVLTLSSKTKFERIPEFRERVAADVAELLFGIVQGQYRDRDRIFVPRPSSLRASLTCAIFDRSSRAAT